MLICVSCRKEMTCVCNGKLAVWHGCHCYSGDEYACHCGSTVLVCNNSPFHSENALTSGVPLIEMDNTRGAKNEG